MLRFFIVLLILLFFLVSCLPTSGQLSTATVSAQMPSSTVSTPTSTVLSATNTPIATDVPSQTPTIEPVITEQPLCIPSENLNHYANTVHADVDYLNKTVIVRHTVHYVNQTGEALPDIVLDVEANNWEGSFSLLSIAIGEISPGFELKQNRLAVELPEPLAPNCQLDLDLSYSLQIPLITGGSQSLRGFYGYSERQLNLGNWLAMLAPHLNGVWVIHPPQLLGEQLVLEQADWDVTINVTNTASSLQLAAPGMVEVLENNQWRVVHNNARDITVSISEWFSISEVTVQSGAKIELYTFPDTLIQGTLDSAAHTLEAAAQSLELYEELFGAYPYERMVVVQGDFPDGMEFSGLVFVSTAWFYGFDGTSANFLTLITVHEVAHQWWYARVGNDSAYAPWLDEALATYSEYLYIEHYLPQLANWWWSFRIAFYNPLGHVDSTVYEFESLRAYINAVYLRGVQMLHQIREGIGEEAFIELLRQYADVADGTIAQPEIFWSLMTDEQLEQTVAIRQEFLRNPDPGQGRKKELTFP